MNFAKCMNLSWKDHVDQVCLKVNRKVRAFIRSFCQLTPRVHKKCSYALLLTPTARRAFFLSVIQPYEECAASAIVRSMAILSLYVECLPYLSFFSVLGFIGDVETFPVDFRWLFTGKDVLGRESSFHVDEAHFLPS